MYGSNCKAADKEGIKILHGSRRVFHNEKQLAFRAVYDIVKEVCYKDNAVILFWSLHDSNLGPITQGLGYISVLPRCTKKYCIDCNLYILYNFGAGKINMTMLFNCTLICDDAYFN